MPNNSNRFAEFLFVDHLQNLHRNIKPEKLEDKCFKQMKGLLLCSAYTKEDSAKAKENVEKELEARRGGGGGGTEAPPPAP